MNDNVINFEKIEKEYTYYHFSEEYIKSIISKDIQEVDNKEWRTLVQMLYPDKMIASGLFQPILIFNVDNKGIRKDPPIEAYNSVNEIIPKVALFIKKNSDLEFHSTWIKYIEEKTNKNTEE